MKSRTPKPSTNLFGNVFKSGRYLSAALLAGLLGSTADAQLLHRYDFNSTNDVVGTANGTLYGTAAVSGGALVTDGAAGGLASGVPQNGMALSSAAVAGITNAFSIEAWFTAAFNGGACTLFSFCDGTTSQYVLATPARANFPYASGVAVVGGGGSTSEQQALGIYVDDNALHQMVITYNGTNITYYLDGLLAADNPQQHVSPTFTDAGLNLSTLTKIAINGGSPNSDNSIKGSTFDFRIYGQALTSGQVSAIYALGADAAFNDITNNLVPTSFFVWNGAGANNNVSTGGNWVGGAAPATAGNTVTFAGSTRTSPDLDSNYTFTGLVFSNNASTFSLGSTAGNTLTLAGDLTDNSANPVTLSLPLNISVASAVVNTNNLTISGAVSGVGSISKSGSGLLSLTAANSLAGSTTVSGGSLKLGDANALQFSALTLNTSNGLSFANGIGSFNLKSLSGSGSAVLTDTAASAVNLSVGANNTGSAFTGVLSGNGGITKLGSATMTMNGASTYSGGTVVSGGILAAVDNVTTGATAPFGTGTILVNSGSTLELGYGPANAFGTYVISNNVTLDNGKLYAFDGSHHVSGNLTINANGGNIGSTFDAPWEGFTEANFPKSVFFDGLLTGSGPLTVQATGWDSGNAWDTSCAVFTSQGTAAQNTYSGTVTVNPASGGGSYLYLVGTNVMANATILLNGDNTTTTPRMGTSTLLFGNGTVDGPGYVSIGALSGYGSLLLADTILFSGGTGFSTGLPVALTVGNNNTSSSYSGVMSGAGSLNKVGSGMLSLGGVNTYTGNTTINGGTLALSGGWLVSTNVTVAAGASLDVSGLGAITLTGYQTLYCAGNVTGIVYTSAGSKLYAGLDGAYGTNAISSDLNLAASSVVYFDLGTTAAGANDKITVGGTLTASGNVVHIKASSTSVNFDAATDYVLFTSVGTISGSFASAPAWDVPPANAGHYSVVTSGNTVTLHYAAFSGPSALGSTTPATAVRNQNVLISVLATNGNPGTVNGVVVDASQLGGSSTLALVSAGGNRWTNSVTVSPSIAAGSKTLAATVSDSASLSANINIPVSVVVDNNVWNGAGSDNNLSSNLNWTNQTAPGYSGDSLEFGGTTRLTPNVDYSYSLTGIAFNSTAGAFNVGTANSSSLTLTANGVVNNSASAQTVNVPLSLSTAETVNAAAGNLTLAQTVTKNGNLFTVTGNANTIVSGGISDSGSLFKKGTGNLVLSASTLWDSAQATSGGFSGPLIDQAGTITFNNGSSHTVTGELVIGGVITNGTAGNNARMVVDGATLTVSSWFSIGRGNGIGGVSSDLVVTNGGSVTAQNTSAGYNGGNSANKPKGSLTLSDTSSYTVTGGSLFIGESDGSDITLNVSGSAKVSATNATLGVGLNSGKGTVNQNGGTVSVGSLNIGSGANAASTGSGSYTLNNGTLNSEGDTQLGFAGNGSGGELGKLVINGGTVNIASSTKRWLIMSRWDTANSELDVNGGQLNINANTDIRFAIGNNSGSNVVNLNGGAITFYSDNATTVGGSGVIDLKQGSGTGVRNTFNLNGGTLTTFGILSAVNTGTRSFNFNGGTLKGVANNAAFLSLGTGSSTVNIRTGGAIIDTAGYTLTIPQALLNNGVDADGGLTKNGNGTLILSGANTYTNNTVVNAGTLVLSNAVLSTVGSVKVASGAGLQLAFAGTNQVAALWLNGVSQTPGVYNAANAATYLSGTGSLVVASPVASYSTNISFTVSGGALHITWPATHLGWILQQQTNSLSAGLGTNWVDVVGSANVVSTNISINAVTPAVFYRLRHP